MLEIIFNFILLLGLITLALTFIYQESKDNKKRNEEYFHKLEEAVSVGVYSALVRFENYKLKETEQVEIMRIKL